MKASSLLLVASLLVVTTGCRTYGDFGTEQATMDQIQTTNQRFADELTQAISELELLQEAAAAEDALTPFVAEYEGLIKHHEAMAASHVELAAGLSVHSGLLGRLTTSYRDLNRALGAIAAEQEEIHLAYDRFLDKLNTALSDFTTPDVMEVGRYQAVPPYYEQIRYALSRTNLREALDLIES